MSKRMLMRSLMLVLVVSGCAVAENIPLTEHPQTDVYNGWRLGAQAYSFNRFTFFEAVDKVASLGMDCIEAYPGQTLYKKDANVKLIHTMKPEHRQLVKQKLKAVGVQLVNYGVVGLPNDEKECRLVFDFAKDMGIETIVSEPPEDAFELIDKLCQEYKIKVAIHNHPAPSHYWNPEKVLEVLHGRSKWIGACADTGHWMRSGIKPLEGLKMLEGRIISFHFKDLNEFGNREAHDMIWGTGKGDAKALLEEIHRQKFKGVFSIEYEHNWMNSVPEIRKCVAYFNKVSGKLKPSGWRDLFKADLSNAYFKEGSWTLAEGEFTRMGGGDLGTKDQYGDFVLDVGFKVGKGSNSGVFLRMANREWLPWPEVQVLDSYGKEKPSKHDCGGIFDVLEPSEIAVNAPGEWNRMSIAAVGSKISVVLNGVQVVDMDLDDYPKAHKNKDDTKNKFDVAYKDLPRKGFIAFQDHGQEITFRNIRMKDLSKK